MRTAGSAAVAPQWHRTMRDRRPPMYASFFALKQEPFASGPDSRFLFMGKPHRQALAFLLAGLDSAGGFRLLYGERGGGKSTVCRCFAEQIPKRVNVAYLDAPPATVEALLEAICDAFGIPRRRADEPGVRAPESLDALEAFLLRTQAVGLKNLLILDEAERLPAAALDRLRGLLTATLSGPDPLQIVLVGDAELPALLAGPAAAASARQVRGRFQLGRLDGAETRRYVAHRLSVAGAVHSEVFDRAALARIHELADGTPAWIDRLCHEALLVAYAGRSRRVGVAAVEKAAQTALGRSAPIVPRHLPLRRAVLAGAMSMVAVGAVYAGLILSSGGEAEETAAAKVASFSSATADPGPALRRGSPSSPASPSSAASSASSVSSLPASPSARPSPWAVPEQSATSSVKASEPASQQTAGSPRLAAAGSGADTGEPGGATVATVATIANAARSSPAPRLEGAAKPPSGGPEAAAGSAASAANSALPVTRSGPAPVPGIVPPPDRSPAADRKPTAALAHLSGEALPRDSTQASPSRTAPTHRRTEIAPSDSAEASRSGTAPTHLESGTAPLGTTQASKSRALSTLAAAAPAPGPSWSTISASPAAAVAAHGGGDGTAAAKPTTYSTHPELTTAVGGARPRGEEDAWRELAALWKLPLEGGPPCRSVERQGLRCHKGNGKLAFLRRLDRPVILTLRESGEGTAYAVLTGFAPSGAAVLQVGGVVRTISIASLNQVWDGEFASFVAIGAAGASSAGDIRQRIR